MRKQELTCLSDLVYSPSDLGSVVSRGIFTGLLLDLNQFSFLTLQFHHID